MISLKCKARDIGYLCLSLNCIYMYILIFKKEMYYTKPTISQKSVTNISIVSFPEGKIFRQ